MDKDKLIKAAEEYAHENSWYPSETFYESDITAMEESFSDTFKAGADWLMQQPLADRLTEEEKERIIKKYKFNDEAGLATAIRTGEMANKHILMRDLLEDIFGEKLFNEK